MPEHQTIPTPDPGTANLGAFFARYSWVIAKNLIGWLLIFSSVLVGGLFPGPLGTPMFLVGFAMVTFPGKRRMTARLLRGIPVDLRGRPARLFRASFAILIPALLIWLLSRRQQGAYFSHTSGGKILGIYCSAGAAAWLGAFWLLRGANVFIGVLPRIRRRVSPWLKRRGLNILRPARSRQKGSAGPVNPLVQHAQIFLGRLLRFLGGRGKPLVGLLIIAAIIKWMFKPVLKHWDEVHDQVMQTSPVRFLLASLMFAFFLLVFRVLSWRKIISAFGYKLPLAASARIWSSSELARYLPGVIWQVWGRVYLARPYGINAAVCSTSQILELAIFLMANLLVALAALPWFLASLTGPARLSFWAAIALAPLLLLLLIPRIFYGRINAVLRLFKRPPIERQLSGWGLMGLLGWAILGLCWQGLAIWLLLGQPQALGLRIGDLPLVIGAYCLAWSAGFVVATAPGGIGVREAVLVWALRFAVPEQIRQEFSSPQSLNVVLFFLAVLLRLWTITGELLLSITSHIFDYRGALGYPDAPGRLGQISQPVGPEVSLLQPQVMGVTDSPGGVMDSWPASVVADKRS